MPLDVVRGSATVRTPSRGAEFRKAMFSPEVGCSLRESEAPPFGHRFSCLSWTRIGIAARVHKIRHIMTNKLSRNSEMGSNWVWFDRTIRENGGVVVPKLKLGFIIHVLA